MRVGLFKKDSSFVSARVILGNFFEFLGRYVETVPVPMSWVPAAALSHRGLVDGDGVVGRLLATFSAMEELKLDYLYPLEPLAPYFFIAREISGSRVHFLISAPCVSPDKWLFHWLLLAPLLRSGDVVMIPNVTTRKALGRISPIYEQQAASIPRSIDLERVDRALAQHAPSTTSQTLVYLGRLVEDKNVHLLVEVMPEVLQQVPGGRLRLLAPVVTGREGNVSPHYYQQIRQRARHLAVEDRVDWTEPPGEEAKYRLLADSAAMVSLSLFNGETFGYAVLEALACGAPVVCTAWSGYRELVTDGHNGFLVPTFWRGNAPCLDEKVLKRTLISVLTRDAKERELLSSHARASAAQYDYRRVMPRLVSVLAECHSAPDTSALHRKANASFEWLLSQPIGATEGIWADFLLRFEELASLSYGAIAGMQCSQAEMMRVFKFLSRSEKELARYLNGEYVSENEE